MSDPSRPLVVDDARRLFEAGTRRRFLQLMGVGGTAVLLPSLFTACDDGATAPGAGAGGAVVLDLGSDVGILNYAYALEQLEAAFYTAVVGASAFGGMTAEQREVMTDLRNHEVLHREFLRQVLGNAAIGAIALRADAVAAVTADAATILRTAETFEDLGVAAYNGAGKYLTSAANLLVAGKIVSVEARHAAAIRDLRDGMGLPGAAAGTRFAGDDVVTVQGGLDVKLEPAAVLARVGAAGVIDTARTPVSIGTPPPARAGTPDFGPPSPTP